MSSDGKRDNGFDQQDQLETITKEFVAMGQEPATPNPFQDRAQGSIHPPPQPQQVGEPTDQQKYNMVSDTVIGANLRISDNLFQLAVIVACIAILAPLGAFVAAQSASPESRNGAMVGGALMGTLAALILGVLSSGVILMVYRGLQHLLGKHD
jgi:hypothetical protein